MAGIQVPTQNPISQGLHGAYRAVDYSPRKSKVSLTRRPQIYACEDGKITAYGSSGDCGNRLELTSADGKRRYGFCHLEKAYVKKGKQVVRGQLIGKMGHTGKTIPKGIFGTHLHQVCLTGGKYIYPPTLTNALFRSYKLGYPKTVTAATNLNIREKPTTKSDVVKLLRKGTKVKVVASVNGQKVGKTNDWFKIKSGQYIWSGGVKG